MRFAACVAAAAALASSADAFVAQVTPAARLDVLMGGWLSCCLLASETLAGSEDPPSVPQDPKI
jgi:hypothetical protein